MLETQQHNTSQPAFAGKATKCETAVPTVQTAQGTAIYLLMYSELSTRGEQSVELGTCAQKHKALHNTVLSAFCANALNAVLGRQKQPWLLVRCWP